MFAEPDGRTRGFFYRIFTLFIMGIIYELRRSFVGVCKGVWKPPMKFLWERALAFKFITDIFVAGIGNGKNSTGRHWL